MKQGRSRKPLSLAFVALFGAAAVALGVACNDGDEDSPGVDVSPSPVEVQDSLSLIATFRVAADETFRVRLTETDDIDIARAIERGVDDVPTIPNGLIVRDETGVNRGYSWSLDPASFDFNENAAAGCDGPPSAVENREIATERYCPTDAELVELESFIGDVSATEALEDYLFRTFADEPEHDAWYKRLQDVRVGPNDVIVETDLEPGGWQELGRPLCEAVAGYSFSADVGGVLRLPVRVEDSSGSEIGGRSADADTCEQGS